MQHLHSPDHTVAVLFAFCNDKDTNSGAAKLFLLLIQQVLILQPQTPKAVEQLYSRYLVDNRYPTSKDVIVAFRESLCAFREIYLLIDGLDELADELEPFLNELISLAISFQNLKILVTSRDAPTLVHFSTFFDGRISIEMQDINTELQLFIRRELDSSQVKRLLADDHLRQRVENSILNKADGSYV